MLEKIKEESHKGTVVVPVGVGSAFAKKNYNSSFIVAKNGKTLLIDLGATVPLALHGLGMKVTDFDAYYFTHQHADHVGGVEELLFMSRYVTKTKPLIITTEKFKKELWENTLKGGIEKSERGGLSFDDLADFLIVPMGHSRNTWDGQFVFQVDLDILNTQLLIFQTLHCPSGNTLYKNAMWSTGIMLDGVMISGDSLILNPIEGIVCDFNLLKESKLIFHDCQLFEVDEGKKVHATYGDLKALPDNIKNKIVLYHYGDNFEDFDPVADGFKGFAKPGKIYSIKHYGIGVGVDGN